MPRFMGTTGNDTLSGTNDMDQIMGRDGSDLIFGRGGDDIIYGQTGNDSLFGQAGFDNLFGGRGDDRLVGGRQNDNLYGEDGDDLLMGDSGAGTAKGSDFGSDNLNGGVGNDTLVASDGNDVLAGGSGQDTFRFKWQDPMIAAAAGTARAFADVRDFNAGDDRLVFDVAGLGRDFAGANFVDGGAGDGVPGGRAASFFSGAAASSNGEAVMILTDRSFATGADAVVAAQGEALGDLIVYYNTTVGAASLLFVDGTDTAHSIARFTDIDSLGELRAEGFSATDFIFA